MADKDLNQLITSLKKEGIEVAEAEARKILAKAEQQAEALAEAAERDKRELLTAARKDADMMVQQGEQALRQAARDLKLALQQELLTLFQSAFTAEVRQAFTPQLIREVIAPVLENVGKDVSLEVPDELTKELVEYLQSQLAEGGDIVLMPGGNQSTQIRIRKTSEGWRYDLSAETITEALRPHLAQRWWDILTEKA